LRTLSIVAIEVLKGLVTSSRDFLKDCLPALQGFRRVFAVGKGTQCYLACGDGCCE
jgi:hypothetical protein